MKSGQQFFCNQNRSKMATNQNQCCLDESRHCFHDIQYKRSEGWNRRLILVSFKLPANVVAMIEEEDFQKFLVNDCKVQDAGKELTEAEGYRALDGEMILAKIEETGRWYRCSFGGDVPRGEEILVRVYALDWAFSTLVHPKNIRVRKILFLQNEL